jgi:hypothetical protein
VAKTYALDHAAIRTSDYSYLLTSNQIVLKIYKITLFLFFTTVEVHGGRTFKHHKVILSIISCHSNHHTNMTDGNGETEQLYTHITEN